MKPKILILDVTESTTTNRGAMATILGAIHCLKQSNTEFEIHAYSARINDDKLLEIYGLKVLPHPWYTGHDAKSKVLLSCLGKVPASIISTSLRRLLRRAGIQVPLAYDEYRAVLVLDADSYNEAYYGSLLTVFRLINLYLARLLIRKPMLVGPATISHFTSPISRRLAKWIFYMPDYIAVRETTTGEYLASMGIAASKRPLIPELGYVMPPSPRIDSILAAEGVKFKRPLIGLAPSQQLPILGLFSEYPSDKRQELNLELMLTLIKHVQEKWQADVLLIPHSPNYQPGKDDRIISRLIQDKMRASGSPVFALKGNYTADELKSVFGRCDLLVACRMHAAIAAVSQGIPTVSLAYGQKYNGVIGRMLEQDEYIISIEGKDYNELSQVLLAKIDDLYRRRQEISYILSKNVEKLNIRVQEYARLTASLLK